jgi:hypothetical protein
MGMIKKIDTSFSEDKAECDMNSTPYPPPRSNLTASFAPVSVVQKHHIEGSDYKGIYDWSMTKPSGAGRSARVPRCPRHISGSLLMWKIIP